MNLNTLKGIHKLVFAGEGGVGGLLLVAVHFMYDIFFGERSVSDSTKTYRI